MPTKTNDEELLEDRNLEFKMILTTFHVFVLTILFLSIVHGLLSPQSTPQLPDQSLSTLKQLVADERALRISMQNDFHAMKQEINNMKQQLLTLQQEVFTSRLQLSIA